MFSLSTTTAGNIKRGEDGQVVEVEETTDQGKVGKLTAASNAKTLKDMDELEE